MLARQIVGYIPSLLIPALAAFGAVYGYTRLLTPEEYGRYTLTMNMTTLLIAVFFYWLQVAIPRLMPQAVKSEVGVSLRVTAYVAFAGVSILLIAVSAGAVRFSPAGDFRSVLWLAVAMTVVRAFLNLNQAFHRSNLDFKRYNLIECGQAVIGLVAGFWLAWVCKMGGTGAILGSVAGMGLMSLVDLRSWIKGPYHQFSGRRLKEISHFGLPLMLSFGLAVIVSTSDRFLIEYFHGPDQVGVYAADYTLMDRIITIVFMMVAMPSFPLAVHKLENHGFKAARVQTYHNGAAALLMALPACAGLILTSRQLAEVFIGPAFREGAIRVMPWIAVSGLLNGLSTHYFDHAFHLGKRTALFAFTLGPAALLNIVLNVLLIPRYGYIAGAWSTLASYALLLLLSITVGRRVFPIWFPLREFRQISAAVALMSLVLYFVPFPLGLQGLLMMAGLGGVTYAAGLLLFNAMNARRRLRRLLLSFKS